MFNIDGDNGGDWGYSNGQSGWDNSFFMLADASDSDSDDDDDNGGEETEQFGLGKGPTTTLTVSGMSFYHAQMRGNVDAPGVGSQVWGALPWSVNDRRQQQQNTTTQNSGDLGTASTTTGTSEDCDISCWTPGELGETQKDDNRGG